MLKNHVFGSLNLNNSEIFRLSFEDIFLGTLDTYTKKMNPPSAVLGGGVHGKVCWLIAYWLVERSYVKQEARGWTPRSGLYFSATAKHFTKRNNNNILQAFPSNICSSEETLPRHTRCTLAQLRTNKSLFLKSYLHKTDAHKHPS